MVGRSVSGQLSDWSSQVVGAADCDSQASLSEPDCAGCRPKYNQCNQQAGNGTQICQTGAGGNSGTETSCSGGETNDTLDGNGADGIPCNPVQL